MPILVHTDCRYYRGNVPCAFHKRDERLCRGCADYEPIKTRILIVKLGATGDVLRTTSILPPLRRKYPGAEVTWLTRAIALPLLQGNPLVDRLLVVEDNFIEHLMTEAFSVGICLDADPLSGAIHSACECERRFGFVANATGRVEPVNAAAREWWLMGLNDPLKRRNRKTYQLLMHEICELPLPTVPPQLYLNPAADAARLVLQRAPGLRGARKIVGINTGGGRRWPLKKWTMEGYVGCINLLRQRYPEVGLLLLGGPEEVEINRRILDVVRDGVVDGGCANSLPQFASIVNMVDVLLTPDSLALHIGVALGKHTIVLVGPTSPWELDVFGNGSVLHADVECLACYSSRCEKGAGCMKSLTPDSSSTL